MSRNPKTENRKRRLPDRDQIEYFRLGYTSIFHVQNFQEQFLEFWHSLPGSYRDDDDETIAERDKSAFIQQHIALNEDEFKHNIHCLPAHLCTKDLITATPHTLIRQRIGTAVNHYMKLNNEKQSLNESSIDDELIALTVTDTPQRRKRRKLTNSDLGLDNKLFGVKLETNDDISENTNTNNGTTLRRSKRKKSKSKNELNLDLNRPATSPPALLPLEKQTPRQSSDKMEEDDSDYKVEEKKSKKRKRSVDVKKKKKKKVRSQAHVLFAANVEMPCYDQLIVPFRRYQQRRKEYKSTNSKKEVNSVTKLSRNHRLQQIEESKGCKLLRESECLLRVAIFHSNKSSERYTKSHEYIVLSTQRLSDLRDEFYCLMDQTPIGKEIKNSYFFIEDTFYDDTRHNGHSRVSQDIIDWSRCDLHWRQTGVYVQKDMQNKRFCDLNLRLGSHYLYVHQGDCQHVLVFTACNIATKWDCNNCYAYPITHYRQILKRQKCGVCEMYPAKYVTYGDKLTTHNPFFFCERCYYPFHYNHEGKLLYDDFQVFDYIHD